MKTLIILIFMVFAFVLPQQANAEDALLFDSTDHYTGGCQLTDTSDWELQSDINVSTFRMWYKWDESETELPITISQDGKVFAEFTATRSQCDPYQAKWCNGDYQINKLFPKGKYSTKISNAKQCLKPGGTGTILLYGSEATAVSQTPSPSVACTSNTKTIVITAIIASISGFMLSYFVSKKR
ncbi:hypothetical protein M0R04_00910 [Candidatus Dojkabacteria bacterium]|jgi:hypothetical protein|nr:hypothetical protein [Candidatus Dojkabacteria bacterium]